MSCRPGRIGIALALAACVAAPAAACVAAPAAANGLARIDRAIAFHRERSARDPTDFITPALLAAAYLDKARVTGEAAVYAAAAAAAERSLATRADHVPALVVLATVRLGQHRFRDAETNARRAATLAPTSPDAAAVLGDALLEIGDLAGSRAAYAILERHVSGLPALGRRASWREATGDTAGALADWTAAIAAGRERDAPPRDLAWAHRQRGAHHFARGRFAAAEADYQAAAALAPEDDRTEAALAELHAAEQRFAEALAAYERLAARVARPELAQEVGDLYAFVNRPEDARAWHDRAEAGYRRAAASGDVRYHHHLASFYADVRPRPAEAVVWARKDLELRQSSAAWDALAWALYRNGDHAAARHAIDAALASGVKDPHLLHHAALIYAASGDDGPGAAFLREAYALNPRLDRFHAHR